MQTRLARILADSLGLDLDRLSGDALHKLLHRARAQGLDTDAEHTALQLLAGLGLGETWFLRQLEHFAVLRELLPALPAFRERRLLKAWSAGCATGEEAYSLAAALQPVAQDGVYVLGTDFDEAAIEAARRGRYRPFSLRGVEFCSVFGWLDIRGPQIEVASHLRGLVEFRVHNLVRDPFPEAKGPFDIIFCRNVLSYFVPEAAHRVLFSFARSLRPWGLLFLGERDPGPADTEGFLRQRVRDVTYFIRLPRPGERAEHPPSRRSPAGAHLERPPHGERRSP